MRIPSEQARESLAWKKDNFDSGKDTFGFHKDTAGPSYFTRVLISWYMNFFSHCEKWITKLVMISSANKRATGARHIFFSFFKPNDDRKIN